MWNNQNSYTTGTIKYINNLGNWQFIKLNTHIYHMTQQFLDICLIEIKTYSHKKPYTRVFTAALFILAKTRNSPGYQHVLQINCDIVNGILLSDKKLLKPGTTCLSLKHYAVKHQRQKSTCCMIPFIRHFRTGKTNLP